MSRLRASVILIGFLCLTFLLMPVQLILMLIGGKMAGWLPMRYHRLLLRLMGVQTDIVGQVPMSPTLLVANHVSWLDIPVLGALMPLSFIAKREVSNWPLFGWMAKLQRSAFINRESRHSTGGSAQAIAERLQKGETLVLFAEGTSHNGHQVLPFKSSYFGVVENSAVAVVPVTLIYYSARNLPLTRRQRPHFAWYGDMDLLPHLWEALKMGPVSIRVQFHAPLLPGPRKAMARMAENTVRASLLEALHGGKEIR